MAISLPKFMEPHWWEKNSAREHNEKMQYMREMEEAKRMRSMFVLDPSLSEEIEKQKAYLLQQAVLKRDMEIAKQKLRQERMQNPAMQCTITDGVNLWIAKFGDGWVNTSQVTEENGMDWLLLAERLSKLYVMESMDDCMRIRT